MNEWARFLQSDAELGLSLLLSGTFEMREDSTGALLHELLHAARLFLGMEIGFISEFKGERRYFRYLDKDDGAGGSFKVGDSDPLDLSFCQRVVDGRLDELIDDAHEVPEIQAHPELRKLDVGGHISTPIRLRDGSVYGTFCAFNFHASHELNERDRALIHVFSSMAGSLIQKEVDRARVIEEKRNRIRELLDNDSFSIVFQPIVEIGSGRIAGGECLSRFPSDPERNTEDWFLEAEQAGMMVELELRAIERGLEALQWLPEDAYVACNISASSASVDRLTDILASMPFERLVLEITEHVLIEDYPTLRESMDRLRTRGLRLAVDDAGAGFASMRHILWLRPDIIKLDMSLTRDIDSDPARQALASSMVHFARDLDSLLVAEGVETGAELKMLEQLGVHMAQGFFLYRPMPISDIRHLPSAPRPGNGQ